MASGVTISAEASARGKYAATVTTSGSVGPRPGSGGVQPHRRRAPHLLAGVDDDALEQLVQTHLGTVADKALDLAEVRHAAPHVLERTPVDLFIRDALDRGRAAAHLADALGQVPDGDLLVRADV